VRRCSNSERNGWCGLCYSNRKGRSNYRGHSHYRPGVKWKDYEMVMQHMRRSDRGNGQATPANTAPPDAATKQKLPGLWEFLTETEWDVGEPRVTGSITFFAEDGMWKACLSDRDQDLVAFVAADTLTKLFLRADEGIRESKLDWRVSKRSQQSRRKGG